MNKTIHSKVITVLSRNDGPRIFTPRQISQIMAKQGVEVKKSSRTIILNRLVEDNIVLQIRHGIYLNRMARPEPTAIEALPLVRQGAVLSMASVLAESGILAQPPQAITAVAPYSQVKRGVEETAEQNAEFKIYLLPSKMFPPDSDEDAWQAQFDSGIKRATPEKALIDWLCLAHRGVVATVPFSSMELEDLDQARLTRLIDKFKLSKKLGSALQITDKRGNKVNLAGEPLAKTSRRASKLTKLST